MGIYAGPAPVESVYGRDCLGRSIELLTYTIEPDPHEPIHKELNRLASEDKQDTEEYWQLIEKLEGDR